MVSMINPSYVDWLHK